MNRRLLITRLLSAIGRFAPILAAALVAAALPARADKLVQALAVEKIQHFQMGALYLAQFKEVRTVGGNSRVATVDIITELGKPPGEFAPATHSIQHIQPTYTLPPIGKPVVMRLFLRDNNAILSTITPGAPQIFLDRGMPGERFYDTTVRLLFPRPGEIDHDVFYKELIELASDADPKIANLAASYIGSTLNIYGAQCPEDVIEAFTGYILNQADADRRAAMAPFFGHARLPRDPQRILALLGCGDQIVAAAVCNRFILERHRAGELAGVMAAAMLATDGPPVRIYLLRVALAWGRSAAPLWDAAMTLVIDAERLGVSQDDQGLAAQMLAQIDAGKARGTIRDALHRIDSPAIYRFAYEQRMYDTVGTLIDKLRHSATRHDDTVRALLEALTRNTSPSGNAGWVAWWDELVQTGRDGEMIRRLFIPDDDTGQAIDTLIEWLGEANYARRRRAFGQLSGMGPMANPRLEAALDHPDAEVAIAAGQLLAENERRMKPVIDRLYGRQGGARPRRPAPAAR